MPNQNKGLTTMEITEYWTMLKPSTIQKKSTINRRVYRMVVDLYFTGSLDNLKPHQIYVFSPS